MLRPCNHYLAVPLNAFAGLFFAMSLLCWTPRGPALRNSAVAALCLSQLSPAFAFQCDALLAFAPAQLFFAFAEPFNS